YSASEAATASSTLGAGSTRHFRNVSAGSPSDTTFTLHRSRTLAIITSCHSSISHVSAIGPWRLPGRNLRTESDVLSRSWTSGLPRPSLSDAAMTIVPPFLTIGRAPVSPLTAWYQVVSNG